MPPATASRTLSTSACVTICRRDAPIASRTAVCPRRATARASSRLATLAHAISSTSPHTASRICRLRPYCSFMTPTPAPAGTTLMTCFGSTGSTSGIQFAGIAGVVLHPLAQHAGEPRRHAVGRRARTQAADDAQPRGDRLAQERVSPSDQRLLLQRNPQIGRIASQRFAEKSRRRDADDGERMALDDERDADDRRIAAVGVLPDVMAQDDHRRAPPACRRRR